jgi:hypothetical protein
MLTVAYNYMFDVSSKYSLVGDRMAVLYQIAYDLVLRLHITNIHRALSIY